MDDIIVIEGKHRIGFEQLLQSVYAVGLDGVFGEQFVLFGHTLFIGQILCFEVGQLAGNVGQHEKVIVLHLLGQPGRSLVGEVARPLLLIDHEIKRFHRLGHTAVVVFHVNLLGLQHTGLDARLGEILDERSVLGEGFVRAIEGQISLFAFFLVVARDETLSFGELFGGIFTLHRHELLHEGLILLVHLVFAFFHRTGDDERCTSIIDEHRVYFIDNGIIVLALYEGFMAMLSRR